jgi:hypothetical protein
MPTFNILPLRRSTDPSSEEQGKGSEEHINKRSISPLAIKDLLMNSL